MHLHPTKIVLHQFPYFKEVTRLPIVFLLCLVNFFCVSTTVQDPNDPCNSSNGIGSLQNFWIADGKLVGGSPEPKPRGPRRVFFDAELCRGLFGSYKVWLNATKVDNSSTTNIFLFEYIRDRYRNDYNEEVQINLEPGLYNVKAQAGLEVGNATVSSEMMQIAMAGSSILAVWSGKNQRVNPDEDLSFGKINPVAYGHNIAVQYLNQNNQPQNGKTVTFSSLDQVTFAPASVQTQATRHPDINEFFPINGYATTTMWYTGSAPLSGQTRTVLIRATSMDGSTALFVDIPMTIQLDRETSTLSGDNRHQRDGSSEIRGDSFLDPDNEKKKVYVEVDYVRGFAPLIGNIQQSDDVGGIMSLVRSIWSNHGVELAYDVDDRVDPSLVQQNITRAQAQVLLQNTRDGDKKRYLHVFIGRNSTDARLVDGGAFGAIIQSQGDGAGDGYSNLECLHLVSGDPRQGEESADYYLSRNGIYIMAEKINASRFVPPPQDRGWDADWKKVYAYTIA